MSRRTSRLHRSPNTSMAALIGHSDRGSLASPIVLAIYYRFVIRSHRAVANHKRKESRSVLIYSMNVSVDGFIADRDGAIGFSIPSDEQFAFHVEQTRELGGFLLG